MKIEVLWGSLVGAENPVLVGHYEGFPLGGAEKTLDGLLEQRLSQRQALQFYPGAIGTVELVRAPGHRPPGAIVAGLGPIDELTPATLRQAVAAAALQYALEEAERATESGARERPPTHFSTVLIGTSGRHALGVEQSVSAIVRGTLEANSRLAKLGLSNRARIDGVQFVELYSDRAEEAAQVVRDIEIQLGREVGKTFRLEPAEQLEKGEGGITGGARDGQRTGSWASPVIRSRGRPGARRLEFTWLGRSAAAGRSSSGPLGKDVEEMVAEVISSPDVKELNNTLFERLVPDSLQKEMSLGHDLVLVVDAVSATYPWELLAPRNLRGELEPLAARAGLLRQLSSETCRPGERGPEGMRALVIADPDTGGTFARIPGAREEALNVSADLARHGYDVTALVEEGDEGPTADEIEAALQQREYRILHVIAHGTYHANKPKRSGVVIGPHRYLTAETVGALPVAPELVFLNCCHLGRTAAGPLQGRHPSGLAASLSVQLMDRGVRAVVASGWQLDARAAQAFCSAFYEGLSEGRAFGDAVREARGATVLKDKGFSNTWVAYQCYGPPDFCIATIHEHPAAGDPPVSQNQAKQRLENIAVRGTDQVTPPQELLDELETLEKSMDRAWKKGEVLFLFGKAYASLGDFERAIEHYHTGFHCWDGGAPLKVLEQLANMEVRTATRFHRSANTQAPEDRDPETVSKITELFTSARKHLGILLQISETPERFALLGSYHKKYATTLDEPERSNEVAASAKAYRIAHELGLQGKKPDPYHPINWILLSAVLGKTDEDQRAQIQDLVVKSGGRKRSFWERVRPPDARLAAALAKGTLVKDAKNILREYRRALKSPHEVRQGLSVLEHLEDLIFLVPSELKEPLQKIRAGLSAHGLVEAEDLPLRVVTPTKTTKDRPREPRSLSDR